MMIGVEPPPLDLFGVSTRRNNAEPRSANLKERVGRSRIEKLEFSFNTPKRLLEQYRAQTGHKAVSCQATALIYLRG